MVDKGSLFALHRHFLTAEAISEVVSADVAVDEQTAGMLGEELLVAAQFYSAAWRLQVFYGLLYVVVEGYQELGCQDAKVDALLARSDLVDDLRRFRNGTFHFQKDPITSPKVDKFFDAEGSPEWASNLFAALDAFFEREFRIKETMEALPRIPKEVLQRLPKRPGAP
jgi:hypothetical protein